MVKPIPIVAALLVLQACALSDTDIGPARLEVDRSTRMRVSIRPPDAATTSPASSAAVAAVSRPPDNVTQPITPASGSPQEPTTARESKDATLRISEDGKTVTYAAGSIVEVEIDQTRTGTGTGPSIRSSSDDIVGKLDLEAPVLDLSDQKATAVGGRSAVRLSLSAATAGGQIALYVIGGIGLLLGAIATKWMPRTGIALIVGGITLIGFGVVADRYPWLILVAIALIVLAAAGGVVLLLRSEAGRQQLEKVTSILGRGIAAAPPSAAGPVKASISAADADGLAKRVVTKLKLDGVIPDPPPPSG